MNYQAICEAIQQQIDNPAHSIVNSESAFVRDRLVNAGLTKEAKWYWNCHCGVPNCKFTPEVAELHRQLVVADWRAMAMPVWGRSGT